uniref:Uncharacterized protein n=1 Tax=Arundo donax TaxID=35708 RepID=A0A0A9EQI8_ARUDO
MIEPIQTTFGTMNFS